ncbi:MAG: 23S rRNA (guanosine(2251)-2'-O)-methyltransferase RlmB [Chitinophagales bacterium]|nr:23S rRNA (guanosine(2251)-2'-O)-methyltransferase RlmB [Chitinophagales bacterium]
MKQQLIIGRNAVKEALEQNELAFEKIFISKSSNGDIIKRITQLAKEQGVVVQFVPEIKINKLSKGNHQGIVAYIEIVPYYNIQDIIDSVLEKGNLPLLLILDGITDVRNFGAIARTAYGLKVDAIVIPKRNSVSISEDAIKVSSGALLHIPVCKTENMLATVKDIKHNGIQLVGLSSHTNTLLKEATIEKPLALVVGAEGEGISKDIEKQLDVLCKLPIYNEVESYNVSVATAMALYEINR